MKISRASRAVLAFCWFTAVQAHADPEGDAGMRMTLGSNEYLFAARMRFARGSSTTVFG